MHTIALQLYTVRDALEKDLFGTLQRVRQLGFESVETAFWPEHVSVDMAKSALDRAGLRVCAAHLPLPTRGNQADLQGIARTFDTKDIVWHGWPRDPRFDTAAGVDAILAEFREATAIAADIGLNLHLHNHWWEFECHGGPHPISRVVEETTPDLGLELDTYWASVAGEDPVRWLRRAADRVRFVHLKDGPCVPDRPKVALGDGAMPLVEICRTTHPNTTWIVEIDDFEGDVFEAIARSLHFLERENALD